MLFVAALLLAASIDGPRCAALEFARDAGRPRAAIRHLSDSFARAMNRLVVARQTRAIPRPAQADAAGVAAIVLGRAVRGTDQLSECEFAIPPPRRG